MFVRLCARLLGVVGAGLAPWHASAAGPAAPPAVESASEPPVQRPAVVWAQQLFEEGSEAYNLGNFDVAIRKFEAAYDLTQAVELLYNIALAYTKRHALDADLEHLRRARLLFENFAAIREADGEDVRDARVRMARLDEQIAAIEAAQRAEAERRAAERRAAELREAERRAARLQSTPPPYRPGKLGVAGYATLGGGLLAGAGLMTVGFASAARLSAQHTAEAEPLAVPASREALFAAHLGEARTLGLVGVGVGVAFTLAGVTMVVVDAGRGRTAARRAALGPGGLTLAF